MRAVVGVIILMSQIRQPPRETNCFCVIPPRLRSRHKFYSDQTHSVGHPCVSRGKLQCLDGSSHALQTGPWSGDDLIRGHFGLESLIIGGFGRSWV